MDPDDIAGLLGAPGNSPVFESHDRYAEKEFNVDFTKEGAERLKAAQAIFDEFVKKIPDLFTSNFGTIYQASYTHVFRDVVIPRFIELTQGKSLRPEGIANMLFKAIYELRKNEDAVRPGQGSIAVNYTYIYDTLYLESKNLAAFLHCILGDCERSVWAAAYAAIKFDEVWDPDLIKLEKQAEEMDLP